jgi:hypothetical protein
MLYRKIFIPIVLLIQNFFYTTLSLFKILVKSKVVTFNEIPQNDIYVLGSGPSLKDILENKISKLINKDVVVFNFFANSSYYETLKPKYYVLVDGSFWINNLNDYVKDLDKRERLYIKRKELFNKIIYTTNWDMTIYFPVEAKANKELNNLFNDNKKIKIAYINTVSYRGFSGLGNWLRKKSLVGFIYQNCILGGLYISIMNRYKNIYILGADHDWVKNMKVNNKNELLLYDVHFYDKNLKPIILESNLYNEYKAFYVLFGEYIEVKKFAKYMEVNIFNATDGGMLDVFDRKELK